MLLLSRSLLLAMTAVAATSTPPQQTDWLIHKPTTPATLTADASGRFLTLANGLIAREFFAGLPTQGVPGVPQDPLEPRRGPPGPFSI